jgi:integrase
VSGWQDSKKFKIEELNNRPSHKDYISLKNALLDYQTLNNVVLTFDYINDLEFMVRFRNFLSVAKPENFLSRGNLKDNTIHKRFQTLKTFMGWVEDKNIYQFKPQVFKFKIKKYQGEIVALTESELLELQTTEFKKESEQRTIDIFLCNCFMGLRYSDLSTMNQGLFIEDLQGNLYYKKTNEKTNTDIIVPVIDTAKNILTKYEYKLPVPTNQVFNRQLKEILERYDLLNTTIKKTSKQLDKLRNEFLLKRDVVSTHTCRKTYITRAIDKNIPLNALMLSTGHTKLDTVKKYMNLNQNFEDFNRINI